MYVHEDEWVQERVPYVPQIYQNTAEISEALRSPIKNVIKTHSRTIGCISTFQTSSSP